MDYKERKEIISHGVEIHVLIFCRFVNVAVGVHAGVARHESAVVDVVHIIAFAASVHAVLFVGVVFYIFAVVEIDAVAGVAGVVVADHRSFDSEHYAETDWY